MTYNRYVIVSHPKPLKNPKPLQFYSKSRCQNQANIVVSPNSTNFGRIAVILDRLACTSPKKSKIQISFLNTFDLTSFSWLFHLVCIEKSLNSFLSVQASSQYSKQLPSRNILAAINRLLVFCTNLFFNQRNLIQLTSSYLLI